MIYKQIKLVMLLRLCQAQKLYRENLHCSTTGVGN